MHTFLPTTLLTLLAISSSSLAARPRDAILLSEVRSLTLHPNAKTTARRTSPIPQLKCVPPNSPICRLPEASDIRTMRCVNSGSSYTSQDIQWTCTTTLPSTLKLDNTNVICEGYDSPDDVYVLKGSCGVEYSLSLTEEGRTKYGNVGSGGSSWEGTGTDGKIFWIIFVAVVAWIFWGAFFKDRNGRGENGGRRARRDNDPPPAYSEQYDQPAFTSTSYSSRQRQQDAGGWRPGFWTGMATGGAMGYAAGARNSNRNTFGSRTSGGLFGGGGSQEGGYYGGGSGSRSAEGQHESTGYGGTSRR